MAIFYIYNINMPFYSKESDSEQLWESFIKGNEQQRVTCVNEPEQQWESCVADNGQQLYGTLIQINLNSETLVQMGLNNFETLV